MNPAKNGDSVKVHYTGRLENGQVFDSSIERAPIEFKLGDKRVITGFENAVVGMSPGESKTISLKCDEAYGPHLEELVTSVDREQFPQHISPEIGQQLEIQSEEGFEAIVTVVDVNESMVTLDANHPLAGKDLTFDIELIDVSS